MMGLASLKLHRIPAPPRHTSQAANSFSSLDVSTDKPRSDKTVFAQSDEPRRREVRRNLSVDVVKRSGSRPTESFDTDKLLRSIQAACLSVRSPEGEAESTAHTVTGAVILWLDTKPVVTSHDIRRLASSHLHRYHPEAAYLYQHHRIII